MNVGIIGQGDHAANRARAVQTLAGVHLSGVAPSLEALPAQVEVVFVMVPTAAHFRIAEAATKRGIHAFLEWPPATSIQECKEMVRLSEEAGVEVGISRLLRYLPVFGDLPASWSASLILLHRAVPHDAEVTWPRWLADAVDLCCALAQSSSVQRIDAEAVRNAAPWPEAVAFGLRFHTGAYAQVHLRRHKARSGSALYVGGPGFQAEAEMDDGENDAAAEALQQSLLEAETHAFLRAVAAGQPAPVSILEGLHTMRLVERLMEKLR